MNTFSVNDMLLFALFNLSAAEFWEILVNTEVRRSARNSRNYHLRISVQKQQEVRICDFCSISTSIFDYFSIFCWPTFAEVPSDPGFRLFHRFSSALFLVSNSHIRAKLTVFHSLTCSLQQIRRKNLINTNILPQIFNNQLCLMMKTLVLFVFHWNCSNSSGLTPTKGF